jgi:hypothetical protein
MLAAEADPARSIPGRALAGHAAGGAVAIGAQAERAGGYRLFGTGGRQSAALEITIRALLTTAVSAPPGNRPGELLIRFDRQHQGPEDALAAARGGHARGPCGPCRRA